ncbi:MAG: aspartate--tRNA ligase [Alphaproteobacteria bacterium]
MHPYRTHTCGELRESHVGEVVRLSGWVHRIRDHGHLLFVDLRDHYGLTQCVVEAGDPGFSEISNWRLESVVSVTGPLAARSADTVNPQLATGAVELRVREFEMLSASDPLPLQVNSDQDYGEDVRLTYRYLDLRRERMHRNLTLRSAIISSIRRRMVEAGFNELQTPILTASSPEGARDYVVPSRVHAGKFYALPQAPQLFKQLLMIAGFDRYFQIAPCFRDEDSRADRLPGEFYQLDFEMSFVTQEDVFNAIEPVIHGVFEEFSGGKAVTPLPFPRIPYEEAVLKYGNDTPDLRNPIVNADVTEIFRDSDFQIFASQISGGALVRAIPAPGAARQPRSYFDKMNDWAREQGAAGLGYVIFDGGEVKGPIAKRLDEARLARLREAAGLTDGDAVFFACGHPKESARLAAAARNRVGLELDLLEKDTFRFCWIVDYPMYEQDEITGAVEFSHNPFSMPQGGLEALNALPPFEIKAYQYDIVCNGIELSSGAIRNHLPEIMYRAFEIAGYSAGDLEEKFGGLLSAFKLGAPPHGGAAPGIDRIVMMLLGEPNLREVVAFPLNQQAEDLMLGAPSALGAERLRELHVDIRKPPVRKPEAAEREG